VIVLDASVWVSVVLPLDAHHAISRQWVRQMTSSGDVLVVPVLFLAEVAGAISRRSGRNMLGRRASTRVTANASFQLEPIDQTLASVAARHAADLPLKGSDAMYVALAERMGIPLVTWDTEQLTRASKLIEVRTPTV
jgi:predicted nucleic acid-binding protein